MFKKVLNCIDKAFVIVSASCFGVVFFVSVLEIILRSFFKFSLLWVQDLCVLLTCWTMLLGGAVLIHRNDHLKVTFLINIFSPKVRQVLSIITRLVLLCFCVILGVHGLKVVSVKMGLSYTALKIPTGYAYLSLPVFGLSSTLFLVDQLVDSIRDLFKK